MTVTGPPDDYIRHLKAAAHEVLSMGDIVERLRAFNTAGWPLVDEAAYEIERLRAVLRYISQLDDDSEAPGLARRALEPKQ